jgi:hypothetical protein
VIDPSKTRPWRSRHQRHAERQRAYYRRQVAGRGVLSVEVDLIGLGYALADQGVISFDQQDDRGAIARAVENILAGLILSHQDGLDDDGLN